MVLMWCSAWGGSCLKIGIGGCRLAWSLVSQYNIILPVAEMVAGQGSVL